MTQSYQLYRTNILLGGQMKYDLVIDESGTINDIHITPVVDKVTPYNRYVDDNLLNYTNQENIKRFYTQTQGSFYKTFVDTTISGDYPMVPNPSRADGATKNYDDSTFMGCSRMEYGLYNKQFQLFLPAWLETEFKDIKFVVKIGTPNGESLVVKEVNFSDKIKKYFNDYFEFIGMDDKIMKIDLDGDCVVHGLNVSTGSMMTRKDFSVVNNITSRERPLVEFNSIIINALKNKNIIAKQLFNFNLCFNIKDIVQDVLEIPDFAVFNITGEIHVDDKKLEIKDFFTNFDIIPKESVTELDVEELLKQGKVTYKKTKLNDEAIPNVLDYKKDNANIDIININKMDQKYIHWSLCDNNEYIFNLYDGWSGVRITNSESIYFSHTYKSSPNTKPTRILNYINTLYWCNYIPITVDGWYLRLTLDDILNSCSKCVNNYINYIKYDYTPKNNVQFGFLLMYVVSKELFNFFEGFITNLLGDSYILYTVKKNEVTRLYFIMDKKMNNCYFLFASQNDINLNSNNIVKMLSSLISENEIPTNFNGINVRSYIEECVLFIKSQVYPKIINFNKSITPVRCPGPNEATEENTYYKIDENYHQYLLRYDGYIKPTFIDSNSNEYNFVYYKDVLDINDSKKIDDSKYKIYKTYLNSEFPPKFPSIQYYPLTSKKLDYEISPNEIANLSNNLCEIKWFDASLALVLPEKINIELINDGNKDVIDIFRDYIKDFIKNVMLNSKISDFSIKHISNFYKINSNIELIDADLMNNTKNYIYRINAVLK